MDKKENDLVIGWNEINGQHYYYTGQELLGAAPDEQLPAFTPNTKYRFVYDPSISELDAANYCIRLLQFEPSITAVMATNTIIGLMHSLFEEAQAPLNCSLYIVGPTGIGKTSVAEVCTRIFDRDRLSEDCSTTANVQSTKIALKRSLDEIKDIPVLVDDLYTADSKLEQRELLHKVTSLTRSFSNHKPYMSGAVKYDVLSLPVVTAEKMLPLTTDMGRVFPVYFDPQHCLLNATLTGFQETGPTLAAFFRYYLIWVSKEYNSILENIRETFHKFRTTPNEGQEYPRVITHAFFLKHIYANILGAYFNDVGATWDANTNVSRFFAAVEKILARHIQTIRDNEPADKNLSVVLSQLIGSDAIKVGQKGDPASKRTTACISRPALFQRHITASIIRSCQVMPSADTSKIVESP